MEKVYIVVNRAVDKNGNMGLYEILGCFKSEDDSRKYCEARCFIDSINYGATVTNPYENHYESCYEDGVCDHYDIKTYEIH